MTNKPSLSPAAFDATMAPRTAKLERLWGRPAIAQALGISEDTVSKWAREPDVPIYQPRIGTYFAFRSELDGWLKTKPSKRRV